jgi:putative transposase
VTYKNDKNNADTRQACWARFRFSVIGPLLSAPPDTGELKATLKTLSEKEWRHPITSLPVKFSVSTLERWYYRAKRDADPVGVLRTKRRTDAAVSRKLSAALKNVLRVQYRDHPGWSCQLHLDNLRAMVKKTPELGTVPSYSTVHRYMLANGLHKRRAVKQRETKGVLIAQEKLQNREIRSFEVDHVHGLWHLDFHHGSRKIVSYRRAGVRLM